MPLHDCGDPDCDKVPRAVPLEIESVGTDACAACAAGRAVERTPKSKNRAFTHAFAFMLGVAESMHQHGCAGKMPLCPEHEQDVHENLQGMAERDGHVVPSQGARH